MNRIKRKQEVISVLELTDLQSVLHEIGRFKPSELINPLFSALCSTTLEVRWHAVSAFGQVVPELANEEMEKARVVMRRFLWSLNDESGGIGWGAPEAMAEIMANDDRLADEYLHMLVSYMREDGPELFQDGNFIELPMLQRGVVWGIGRLCNVMPSRMNELGVRDDLAQYLLSEDHVVRGLALWSLANLQARCTLSGIDEFMNDTTEVMIYHDGRIEVHTVCGLVERYLDTLDKAVSAIV